MKWLALILLVAACGSDPKLAVEKLEDPATCKECHPKHFQQWSGSMHAYASDDPVFLAMNKRGQRETNNQLGTFCIQCHAPMAVALKLTDGTNFDPTALPPQARGITCFFCHNVESIKDDHNNGLVVALDDTMRGGIHKPIDSPAHNSAFDDKMHGSTSKSQMCGSCHDVITPKGVELERSFREWQTTVFAHDDPANLLPVTCSNCHMKSSTDVIADKPGLNVPSRTDGFHEHTFPAIDQAMTPFPEQDAQAAGIKDILDPALTIVGPRPTSGGASPGGICLDPPGNLTVRMDTISTGHMYPSGAAQDRRVWLEVIAYRADNSVVFQSGVVPDGTDPEDIADPNLVWFYDKTFKDDGTQAHFFWDVATVQSRLLKPPVTLSPQEPGYDHSTTAMFQVGSTYIDIDHITARVRTRQFAYSILDQLVMSGDLDPAIAAMNHTLDSAGASRTWTKATKGTGSAMFTNCNPN